MTIRSPGRQRAEDRAERIDRGERATENFCIPHVPVDMLGTITVTTGPTCGDGGPLGNYCEPPPLFGFTSATIDFENGAQGPFGNVPVNVIPGTTHYFQRWNRDPFVGTGSNLSDAIAICMLPPTGDDG